MGQVMSSPAVVEAGSKAATGVVMRVASKAGMKPVLLLVVKKATAAGATGAAGAAGGMMAGVPGFLAGVIGQAVLSKILSDLAAKPKNAVPIGEEMVKKTKKSVDGMIAEARRELGIDCKNHFNFAFCGSSGTGKSSLINALCGIRDGAEGAALVGENEETLNITSYPHPDIEHIVFWDIPGAETPTHPGPTYFVDKKLYAFDMLIIIGATRFKHFDLELAKAAAEAGTPVVFVRSKCDQDIDNRARRLNMDKAAVKDELRADIRAAMKKDLTGPLADREIFLISSPIIAQTPGMDVKDYGMDEGDLIADVCQTALARRCASLP